MTQVPKAARFAGPRVDLREVQGFCARHVGHRAKGTLPAGTPTTNARSTRFMEALDRGTFLPCATVGTRRHLRVPLRLGHPARDLGRHVSAGVSGPQARVRHCLPPRRSSAVWEGGLLMSIRYDDVGEDLRRIVISGRLDMPGTDSVASQLAELAAAPKKGVVVDLSAVRLLASIGIGALISSAKAVQKRGGRMVLVVDAGSTVMMSLEATGVDQLIPVFESIADADKAALA